MALVRNRASLISAGTEVAALQFGEKSLLQKARSRPDLVRQVVRKVGTDGLRATYAAVQARLDEPLALGYSCAGEVVEAGEGAFVSVGDRVACAGGGYAAHAEFVVVPRNLVAVVPEGVSYDEAAFTTVGAIALQGLRVGDVRVGERVVVVGLGLVGLLTVQLLKAAGCLVMGTDPNPARVRLAEELGANEAYRLDPEAVIEAVDAFTRGRGVDAVLITAATKSSDPIALAGEISRLKGRVVAVGDVGMDVPRRTYYEKELDLRLSRSYGPGRYDPAYEEKGIDYPYAYVPFTEQRNMETFLNLTAEGKVTPGRLITHRFGIEDAEAAYTLIRNGTGQPSLGVLFSYPETAEIHRKVNVTPAAAPVREESIGIGFIGAGVYARQTLLPSIKGMDGVRLIGVSTSRGISAADTARRFGFQYAATDAAQILNDPGINLVIVATRHDSHASLARAALEAGKHVFVEKPLAVSELELSDLLCAAETSGKHLAVGFNRRFAPLIQRASQAFSQRTQPLAMLYRVNAGATPASHWSQDPEEGGGRIIGEVCHFVDLLQFLCGAPPIRVMASSVSGEAGSIPAEDIVSITIEFGDGSLGTVLYFANGDRAIPKEYLEVYGGGRTFILEDFRKARFAHGSKVEQWKLPTQDKGHRQGLESLIAAIREGKPAPIPLMEAALTTLTTFRALDSLHCKRPVAIDLDSLSDKRTCSRVEDEA